MHSKRMRTRSRMGMKKSLAVLIFPSLILSPVCEDYDQLNTDC